MGLKKYHAKRMFDQTLEPKGREKSSLSSTLSFCVQKHAARQLHYDFRLEYRGVLLSWAVPKGPSLNPSDKRLAIHVEDHPLDYQYFEGVIPKGNYGAGTVEIWDMGTYAIPDCKTRKEMEKKIALGLEKGHIDFILNGEKLQGRFVLQKLKKEAKDQSWLLIKAHDTDLEEDGIAEPASQVSQLEKKAKIPSFISPMLATLVKEAFNGEEWLFEVKWDGFRGLAWLEDHSVRLISRNKIKWNDKFPSIINELKKIPGQAVLDGELVVLDAKGRPQFDLMQNYQKEGKGALYYYIFDILFKDGNDLRDLPLIERKSILKNLLASVDLELIRFSDYVVDKGKALFKKALQMNLEGIIGKKLNSVYESRRSPDWVKIKTSLRQDVVVGGFTEPKGSREKFGALLVGIYDDQQNLIYTGHVGGGFDAKLLGQAYEKLKALSRKKSPFKTPPLPNMPVTWVKPKLVCEVSFASWTRDNLMRQPIFHGFRPDISPKAVLKEKPIAPPEKKELHDKSSLLSNLDKIYWPKEEYTKGDLIEYYRGVAPFILPYLKNHPLMMHRFPEGIKSAGFYQKNINFIPPKWIKTFQVTGKSTKVDYVVVNDLKSLMYVINLGCIELHPFISTINHLEYPEFCVIDLDPLQISFAKVVETALIAHDILERAGIKNFCKTSGLTGLHILIPLHHQYSFEQSKLFAQVVAECIHDKLPHLTSLVRSPQKRSKKIYLDYLQNRFAQTLVCPYSVRPAAFAPVSTPLLWEEVNSKLDPTDFTIKTVPQRLKEKGDILKPILKASSNLKKAISRLENRPA